MSGTGEQYAPCNRVDDAGLPAGAARAGDASVRDEDLPL